MTAANPLTVRRPAEALAVSVVVPVFDEEWNIGILLGELREALRQEPGWEVLVVDDGSRDRTAEIAAEVATTDARVRLIRLGRNYGQAAALQAGFDHARGEIVVTIDGDLQNDPADIPVLLVRIREGYDLVVGRRTPRTDPLLTRRLPSWFANAIVRLLTGLPVRDIGCTLKAYRRAVLDRIELYSDHHRFTPVLAAASSAARIVEVPVRHRPRRYGRSKYGLGRVPRVLADLLIVKMIHTFHDRPLALFGTGAFAALGIAFVFALAALFGFLSPVAGSAEAVVLSGMAMLFIALGSHLLLLGVLGEVLVRQWMPAAARRPRAQGAR